MTNFSQRIHSAPFTGNTEGQDNHIDLIFAIKKMTIFVWRGFRNMLVSP